MGNVQSSTENILAIAKVCHQAIKAFCEANGDFSQKDWEQAEEWQQKSSLEAVAFRIANPGSGYDVMHISWMDEKIKAGWSYGKIKDSVAKTHPCLVPFEQLPKFQQQKDALFCVIVDALKSRK
jgi:hypothetical protein